MRSAFATAKSLSPAQRALVLASYPDDISGLEGCGVLLSGKMYSTAKSLQARKLGNYAHGCFTSDMYWNTINGLRVREAIILLETPYSNGETNMAVSLFQFEAINELYNQLVRMGDFETCADPRGYIRTSNRLLDTCIAVLGKDHVDAFASAEDCAADFICRALSSPTLVEAA